MWIGLGFCVVYVWGLFNVPVLGVEADFIGSFGFLVRLALSMCVAFGATSFPCHHVYVHAVMICVYVCICVCFCVHCLLRMVGVC